MNGDLEGPAANTLIPFLCLSNGAFGKSVTDRDVFLCVCVCVCVCACPLCVHARECKKTQC